MPLSAKADYACLAVLELALRHGSGMPVRLSEIAVRHRIPPRFLVQIFLQLRAAGVVTSVRGARGGYRLAGEPETVTLADVLDVIDPAEPGGRRRKDASPLRSALRQKWDELAAARTRVLKAATLADLVAAGQGAQLQYEI
jgi:Rrf2 family protein